MSVFLKAILIDDEQHAVELLENVLKLFKNNIQIVGKAYNLPKGIQLINDLKPDVVFLDIDMPNYSGLQIDDFYNQKTFELVFVTAHAEHAIQAMRIEAFDYILKPIEIESLKNCINRLNDKILTKSSIQLKHDNSNNNKKIEINTHKGTFYINISDIYYIEASSMYSVIHLMNEQIIVSKPLKDFEYLINNQFYRVHRSFLVNTEKIIKFSQYDGSEVELNNGFKVNVSISKKDDFKLYMRRIYGIVAN